jgi:membrane protease YdiL (CAAX protease family)
MQPSSPPVTGPLAPIEPFPPPAHIERFTPLQRRLIAVGEVVLCSSVPTQLLIGALLGAAGWGTGSDSQWSLPFVLTLLLADTLIVIVLMVWLTRVHGESPSALWLGVARPRRELLIGLVLIPAVFLMVVILLNGLRLFAPWLHDVKTNPLEQLAGNTPVSAATFGLVAILAGGVREELQRAFVLRRFEQHLGGANVGVVVSSIAFGLAHKTQGWDAVITTAVLGFFWALLYLDRRSSIAPVISHAGFNSLEILRVALVGQ